MSTNSVRDLLARDKTKGSTCEKLVEHSQAPHVMLTKIPNGVQYIRGGGTVKKKGPCDWMGMRRSDSRMIVIDSKESREPDRVKIDLDHFSQHQRDQLIRYGRAGALAGAILLDVPQRVAFWLDFIWLMPENRESCAALPSLKWSDHRLRVIGTDTRIDWPELFRCATNG